MIRAFGGARYWLAVVSARRSANVAATGAKVGAATWYVPDADVDAYAAAGAASVVSGGALCPSRNAALQDAWGLGLPCVQVSDDIGSIRRAPTGGALTFEDAVVLMNEGLDGDRRLAGCAPTDNLFFYGGKPLATAAFIVGDLILVRPCSLFFDEALHLKEDYDYTLAHLNLHGEVARRNDVLASFAHRSNKGGAVAYRTPALEAASIAYLTAKWPGCLRPNPKRPGEVLMTWPPGGVAPVAAR